MSDIKKVFLVESISQLALLIEKGEIVLLVDKLKNDERFEQLPIRENEVYITDYSENNEYVLFELR